jgi:hypothetical protein
LASRTMAPCCAATSGPSHGSPPAPPGIAMVCARCPLRSVWHALGADRQAHVGAIVHEMPLWAVVARPAPARSCASPPEAVERSSLASPAHPPLQDDASRRHPSIPMERPPPRLSSRSLSRTTIIIVSYNGPQISRSRVAKNYPITEQRLLDRTFHLAHA